MARFVIPEMSETEAREELRRSDWYVIRQVETGKPIPPDVSDLRARARAAISAARSPTGDGEGAGAPLSPDPA